jgi:hypothetical protein
MHELKSYGEGSFITYETSALTLCLNIKAAEVVCVPRVLQFWSFGVCEMVSPWPCFSMTTYGPSHFDSSFLELSV